MFGSFLAKANDRILLFRDGVGERQIKYVMENEVETMKVSFLLALATP